MSTPTKSPEMPVNPYPDMTLAEFFAEFPEVGETWKVFQFFSGVPNGKTADAINAFLYNKIPQCAERISRFVEPSVYVGLLRGHMDKLPVFKHIVANHPEIITDEDISWLLKPKKKDFLKAYVSGVTRERTVEETADIIRALGYEEAAPLVEFKPELVDYLFGVGDNPSLACKILSRLGLPVGVSTLMETKGAVAHDYFKEIAPGCFSDSTLYLDAVNHCAPSVPETIAGLYSRGTPVTSSLMRNPEFAPFKHYLLACM